MYILSLDTTAKTASVCISETKQSLKPICQSNLNSTLTHSESLLPMIDFCLTQARLRPDQIEGFAIAAGPGSFTGVRIGISALKGLAFAAELRTGTPSVCVPVSTLYALSLNLASLARGKIICPVMDARRDQVYNALFTTDGKGNTKRLCADRLCSAEELLRELTECFPKKEIHLVGDGAALCDELFRKLPQKHPKIHLCGEALRYQNAFSVAMAANFEQNFAKLIAENHGQFDAANLAPVYLRASQAEREKNQTK